MSIRLLIVEDHEMVRSGLARLVEGTDIEVVGEAATMADAVRCAQEHEPDVVIMTSRLPDAMGRAACDAMKQCRPEAAVVLMTSYDGPHTRQQVRNLGASATYVKGSGRDQLLAGVRAAYRAAIEAQRDMVAWPSAMPATR